MLNSEILDTFRGLLDEAKASGDREPTAMNLATVDSRGRVHSRIVLLKAIDEKGLRFFTNYESAKAGEIAEHDQVALCFHWKQIREGIQVRFEGRVSKASVEESDAYFARRPRGSQIGAWASKQSQELPDRKTFDERVAHYEKEFEGRDVPRPPHWGGYLVEPDRVEFWYGATFRLHERIVHTSEGTSWTSRLLYP
ncbi:pyridoxamine 5'-phosphate oxidase [Luteibacter sp. UNCMF366Tsu5.1]|uniref:pyridoxamine 5'-phosphate oxidase n=1 Tax=Luteibacter sp. UNCMF366Tsu5.1 TaxID=1502758 RepID=UPI000908A250|nr:pyridoxamine 5'-phosphate oxidase [Luteibacter sp. UNCMF366Tsu5.1]SFW61161.1 Pyridoxamine 5'-phosphate oxidase [Luteibacter sp. UNCMF366Tsu5.1]